MPKPAESHEATTDVIDDARDDADDEDGGDERGAAVANALNLVEDGIFFVSCADDDGDDGDARTYFLTSSISQSTVINTRCTLLVPGGSA